jgi:hypothetical protein
MFSEVERIELEPNKTTPKREWAYSNTIFAIRFRREMVCVTVKQLASLHRFSENVLFTWPICLNIIQPYCTWHTVTFIMFIH